MPLIGINPKTSAVEDELSPLMSALRPQIKALVSGISGFPENDVIVSLHHCTMRDPDPDASEIVVFIDTNPNETLEAHAEEIRDGIAQILIDEGLTDNRNAEVWPRFLPGSWCLITNGEIVGTVDHQTS